MGAGFALLLCPHLRGFRSCSPQGPRLLRDDQWLFVVVTIVVVVELIL